MDVEELIQHLRQCQIDCSVDSASDEEYVLSVQNRERFGGNEGQIVYQRKGKTVKLCASFDISSVWNSSWLNFTGMDVEECTVKVTEGKRVKVKFTIGLDSDLRKCITELSKVCEQVARRLVSAGQQNTDAFTEAVSAPPVRSEQRFITTRNESEKATFLVEGTSQDLENFKKSIPTQLAAYFLWTIEPGVTFTAKRWYLVPMSTTKTAALDWAMSLYAQGLAFAVFPCKYLIYHEPVHDFRFIPAPRHSRDFALVSGVEQQQYSCNVAKEMTLFISEWDCPCPSLLGKEGIMSKVSPSDRLQIDSFETGNLSECQVIGKGGFGNILLNALHISGQRVPVAMKVIKSEKIVKSSNIDALINEYHLMRSCNHPNVTRVFGYTLYFDMLVIVMEYCSNKTLYKFLFDRKLDMTEKTKLLLQIARGVVFLHAKNFCHLDLKPHNILIDSEGNAKLSDFGLSKMVAQNHKAPVKSGYTLLYSAPEQIDGLEPGLEADMWAFGNIVYFVCFQKGPIDYVKSPGDNVHSFATKKIVLTELKEKRRKPLIPDFLEGSQIPHEFEVQYPLLVHLMRRCWVLDPNLRITAKKAEKLLLKVYNLLLSQGQSR